MVYNLLNFCHFNSGGIYMKKIMGLLLIITLLVGCSINLSDIDNTPTTKVEAYFNNYQTLSKEVLDDLDLVVAKETTLTTTQKQKYRDIIKKHFKNLNYTIKDETVNGDAALVEVEIQVTDFNKVLNDKDTKKEQDFYEEGQYNIEAYNDYRLDLLSKAKDYVKYTLYINLEQDDNNEWVLKDLSNEDEQKILGMYEK